MLTLGLVGIESQIIEMEDHKGERWMMVGRKIDHGKETLTKVDKWERGKKPRGNGAVVVHGII